MKRKRLLTVSALILTAAALALGLLLTTPEPAEAWRCWNLWGDTLPDYSGCRGGGENCALVLCSEY